MTDFTVRAVKTYNDRWVLVDKKTGIIVDTAQGYGYRSPRNAYACWDYKHPYGEVPSGVEDNE